MRSRRGGRGWGLGTHRLHLAGALAGRWRGGFARSHLGARPLAQPADRRGDRRDRAAAAPALERAAHRPCPGPAGLDRRHRAAPARAGPPERPRGHAGSDALRAQRGRRAAPHRQQEARQDRRLRPPDHRRSARPPDAWPRLGIPACRGRRCLAPGRHGAPARRARPELRRLPRPRRRLVRRPRRPDRAGHDRQCLRLHPVPRFQGHPRRARGSAPDHAALLPAHHG